MEQTINLNASHCIERVSNFGSTTIINICSGKTSVVPWGSIDWAAFVAMSAIGCAIFVLVAIIVFAVTADF